MRREAFYNSLLAVSMDIEADNGVLSEPMWFASALEGDELVGCALHARPDGLLLSEMPESAVSPMAARFLRDVSAPTRIIGPPEVSAATVRIVNESIGTNVKTEHSWSILEVTRQLLRNRHQNTSVILCSQSDESFVAAWGKQYDAESPSNVVNVQEFLLRKLRSGNLYKIENDGPKCIASVSGSTNTGIRISAVYTPPEFRRLGYANALVGALAQRLLKDGFHFVTLSVSDAARSAIDYRKLGFQHIGTRISYTVDTYD